MDNPDPSIVILMRKAAGVICKRGGLTCHLACVGRELGIPVLVGVNDVYDYLKDNMVINMKCENNKGVIYAIN